MLISQAVYTGARTVGVRSVPDPDVRAGHVVIDVAYTGLCGTDLHIFHGDMDARVTLPAVIGHEMSGRVAAVGDGVTGWEIGAPVTAMPLVWCGTCPACRAGNNHICHRLDFLGIDAEGSMQESWQVAADRLIALPEGLPLRDAALVEPTAVAVHDVRRARVAEGEFVAVVDRWTDGAGAGVAFEVSGAAAGVDTAVAVLATRGRLCLVAIHPKPREVDLHRFFWRELTLIGARLYERADWERAVELVAGGDVVADVMISRVVGLNGAQGAFEAIESGGGVMKVLVDCSQVAAVAGDAS